MFKPGCADASNNAAVNGLFASAPSTASPPADVEKATTVPGGTRTSCVTGDASNGLERLVSKITIRVAAGSLDKPLSTVESGTAPKVKSALLLILRSTGITKFSP